VIVDRAAPEILVVMGGVREPLDLQNLWVHAGDQHFLVVGAVEDADPSAFRQVARGAPEKVVFQFGGAGVLETEPDSPVD
jgi:hypothetical protein